jgi:hypothetical protein
MHQCVKVDGFVIVMIHYCTDMMGFKLTFSFVLAYWTCAQMVVGSNLGRGRIFLLFHAAGMLFALHIDLP